MNKLIYQQYFQYILNEFIIEDKHIIPWKFVCKANYYYKHRIHIFSYNFSIHYKIFNYLHITLVNTTNYYIKLYTSDYIYITDILDYYHTCYDCVIIDYNNDNVIVDHTHDRLFMVFMKSISHNISYNYFDCNLLPLISNTLTHLTIFYEHSKFTNIHLSFLHNLEFLDIGMNSLITDFYLPKLETLYLRNNDNISLDVITQHRNLKYLQICRTIYYVDEYRGISPIYYKELDYIDIVECFVYNNAIESFIVDKYNIRNKLSYA